MVRKNIVNSDFIRSQWPKPWKHWKKYPWIFN